MTSQTGVNKWLKKFNAQKKTPVPINAAQDKPTDNKPDKTAGRKRSKSKKTPVPIDAAQDESQRTSKERGRSKTKSKLASVEPRRTKIKTHIADLINLTIGMNLDNNGSAVDAYGSENCGEGYGY